MNDKHINFNTRNILISPNKEMSMSQLDEIVKGIIGSKASLSLVNDAKLVIVDEPNLNILSRPHLWEFCYKIKSHDLIKDCFITSKRPNYNTDSPQHDKAETEGSYLKDDTWSQRHAGFHKLQDQQKDGRGITIASIDTGYVQYYRGMKDSQIETDEGWDFLDGDSEPFDVKVDAWIDNPLANAFGHGTGTIHRIIGEGKYGCAQGVKVIPIRCDRGVWPNFKHLYNSLKYAINSPAEVVTISMGGAFNQSEMIYLDELIDDACRLGMIIVAAGPHWGGKLDGDKFDFTGKLIYPCLNPKTIGVTGSDRLKRFWFSAVGFSGCDIAAGCENVHVPNPKSNSDSYSFSENSGTSYATPMVAAAAAIWLSENGVENLEKKYGKKNIYGAFRKQLRNSAISWSTILPITKGYGMLDAHSLITKESLPSKDEVNKLKEEENYISKHNLLSIYLGINDDDLESVLSILINIDKSKTQDWILNYSDELITAFIEEPELLDAIQKSINKRETFNQMNQILSPSAAKFISSNNNTSGVEQMEPEAFGIEYIHSITNHTKDKLHYYQIDDKKLGTIPARSKKRLNGVFFPWCGNDNEFYSRVLIIEIESKARIYLWERNNDFYYSVETSPLQAPFDRETQLKFNGNEMARGKWITGHKDKDNRGRNVFIQYDSKRKTYSISASPVNF